MAGIGFTNADCGRGAVAIGPLGRRGTGGFTRPLDGEAGAGLEEEVCFFLDMTVNKSTVFYANLANGLSCRPSKFG